MITGSLAAGLTMGLVSLDDNDLHRITLMLEEDCEGAEAEVRVMRGVSSGRQIAQRGSDAGASDGVMNPASPLKMVAIESIGRNAQR